MSERIATKCPACHNSTLVIGGGNWLVCSLIGCPDPTRINSVGDRADSHFDELQTLRDERDRLLKIVEYGAAIDNALFMRGEHVETYEARCRYLADRCRKLLAALTPAGGGKNEHK